ncbi:RNA polymerase sigma factor [Filimonas effusa]|uniref:RNA polymerase sigma-70 region 2 domain-containing protein n=1 Tax=Filimonas effusa TaxID=2508721 RepID=A0A4Q1D3H5_9BACT|nr:sigma factor [Filimonas effusa]RXK81687.1 hypothetical protein ESB13_17985 [Filimonas effusa]
MLPIIEENIKQQLNNKSTKHQAFSNFYEQMVPHLVAWLTTQLGDRAEAEDIAQEAFTRFWMIDDYSKYPDLRTLIFKIAINKLKDDKKHAAVINEHNKTQSYSYTLTEAEKIERKVDLSNIIKRLPDNQVRFIALLTIGATQEEIANAVNLKYKTSWKQIKNLVIKVQKMLSNEIDQQNAIKRTR